MRGYWNVTKSEMDRILASRLRGTGMQDFVADLRTALDPLQPVHSPDAMVRRVLRAMLPYTWVETYLGETIRCIRENEIAVVAMMLGDEKTEAEAPEANKEEEGE